MLGRNPVVVGRAGVLLIGLLRLGGIASERDQGDADDRSLQRREEHDRQQRLKAEPRADTGEEPDVAPAHRLLLEQLLADQGDGGEEAEPSGGADQAGVPGQLAVPERRGKTDGEQRPGDLVRQEPGVEIDVRQREQRRGEGEVSERGHGRAELAHDGHRQHRRDQLHQGIPRADGLAAAAALRAQEHPGDERDVVEPGDGRAALRTVAAGPHQALAFGHAGDDDVEEAAHHRAGAEDPEMEGERRALGESGRPAASPGDEKLLQRAAMGQERDHRRAGRDGGFERRARCAFLGEGEDGTPVALQDPCALGLQPRHQLGSRRLQSQLYRPRARRHQVGERAAVGQARVDHDADPVADGLDVAEDVRREEHGAALVAQREDDVAHVLAADGIKAAHRLVEDDGMRIADERLREPEALHHPFGEAADGAVGASGEADSFQQGGGLFLRVGPREPRQAAGEDQVFVAAEEFVEGRILRQVAEVAARLQRARRRRADEGAPARRPDEPEQHLDGGGLACAVGPEQAEDLPAPHLEGEILHGAHPPGEEPDPEDLAQPFGANGGVHQAPILLFPDCCR